MHPLAILLGVLSAVTHAWREMQTKRAHDKQIFVWWFGLVALVVYFPLFLYFLLREGLTLPGFLFIFLSGAIHTFYWYFLSKAYEEGDLSHVYPIMRSSPALVLVLSVLFLGEQVSLQGVLGILTILCGVYLISVKQLTKAGILEPLQSFRDPSTRYALFTAVTVAMYSITDKLGVAHVHPVIYVYGIVPFVWLMNSYYILRYKKRELIMCEWHSHPWMILVNGFLTIFSYLLILIAFTFERVSYVTSVRQLSIVFGVLLGGHVLREKHRWIRFIAAGIIFLGVVLIALAS